MMQRPSASIYLLCALGAVIAGGLSAWIQKATLQFGFLDGKTLLTLAVFYSVACFILFLIINVFAKRTSAVIKVRPVFFYLGAVVVLIGFTQFNSNTVPNVLLIVSDATRADHLSLYGYHRKTTPFLERFAQESFVFNQAMAQGTHTIVSTPSILGSVYPSAHQLTNYQKVLNDDFVLMPEMLKTAGYRTFGCVANPHLGPKNGFAQGYDQYLFTMGWGDVTAFRIFNSLIPWLSGAEGLPFFGFLFCVDPHTPYSPPPPYNRLFDPAWQGKFVHTGVKGKRIPEPELFNMIAQYDGEIALVDKALEGLIKQLKERDLYANTLIIYTSDHGEDLYDREEDFGHEKAPYEEVARIPLVVRFPSPIKFPSFHYTGRSDEVVSHVDILPTIAEFLHVQPPKTAMGVSFMDLVRHKNKSWERVAYLEEILEQYGPYDIRAVRTKRYKLIKFLQYEKDTSRKQELYDLKNDPKERDNLFEKRPDIAKNLQEKMDTLATLAQGTGAKRPGETQLDKETLERLRALGYL